MRFIGSSAMPDRQSTPSQNGLKHFYSHISLNADLLLHGKHASKLKQSKSERWPINQRAAKEHEFWAHESRSDCRGYKSLEAKLKAQELLLGNRERLDTGSEMAKSRDELPRLMLWPALERPSQPAYDAHQARNHDAHISTSERAGLKDGIHRKTVRAPSNPDYYDPAKEPLSVSQQTSASAVRDMGLRKSFSNWKLYTPHDPTLTSPPSSRRTISLKSAIMKKSQPPGSRDDSQQDDASLMTGKISGSERKPRRLDLAQFFPQQRGNSVRNLLSSDGRRARSPSAVTDASVSVYQQQGRKSQSTVTSPVLASKKPTVDPVVITRMKVFDDETIDPTKKNVRRPPKGIQNWFDGFDISSDEDERVEPVNPSDPQSVLQELPAEEKQVHGGNEKQVHGGQPLPSTFSPWSDDPAQHPTRPLEASKNHESETPMSASNSKVRLEEQMKFAHRRENSADSGTLVSALSIAEQQGAAKKPRSRLASSLLATESVLSLSDSEGDDDFQSFCPPIRDSVDDASIFLGNASQMDVHRVPVSPPRQLHSCLRTPANVLARTRSASTVQTSGSIPIRLTSSAISSLPPHKPSPLASPPRVRGHQSRLNDKALRKLEGRTDSASQPTTSICSFKTPNELDLASTNFPSILSNADAETLHSYRTRVSSALTEGGHMMEVTEDEMQLLELIRQRRAMKAKDSFTEGYQLALKKEHEAFLKRRQSAQQTALQLLSLKAEKQRARDARLGRRTSTNVVSGEIPGEHIRRRYNALKEEEVDQALKLERFLAASGEETPMNAAIPETSLADKFPDPPSGQASYDDLRDSLLQMESRSRSPRAVVRSSQAQQLELLLPDIYSPDSEKAAQVPAQSLRHRSRRSMSEPPAGLVQKHERSWSPVAIDRQVGDHTDVIRQFFLSGPSAGDKDLATSQKGNAERQSVSENVKDSSVQEIPDCYRQESALSKIISGLKLSSESEHSSTGLPHEPMTEDHADEIAAPAPASPPPRIPRRTSPPNELPGDEANDPMPKTIRPEFQVHTVIANRRCAFPIPLRPGSKAACHDGTSVRSPSPCLNAPGELLTPSLSHSSTRNSSTPTWTHFTTSPAVGTKAPTERTKSDSSGTLYSQLTASHSSASSPPPISAKKLYSVNTVAKCPRLDTIMGNQRSFSTGANPRTSMCSYTSASEEVMARWAELGGVRDMLAMRARRARLDSS